MLKIKAAFYLLSILALINFKQACAQSHVNIDSLQDEFFKDIIQQEYTKIQKSKKLNIEGYVINLYINKSLDSFLTNKAILFSKNKASLENNRSGKFYISNKDSLPNFGYFKFINDSISIRYGKPVFSFDYKYVIVGYSQQNICLYRGVFLYKRKKNGWKQVKKISLSVVGPKV